MTDKISDAPRPCFIGRRQQHLTAVFSTRVDASAGVGGLAARLGEDHFLAIEANKTETGTNITARMRLAGFEHVLQADLPAGDVELRIEMKPPAKGFTAGAVGGDRVRLIAASASQEITLTELDGRYWSYETAKTFTGRVVGVYAVAGHREVCGFQLPRKQPGDGVNFAEAYDDLIAKLDLGAKVRLLTGASFFSFTGDDTIGLTVGHVGRAHWRERTVTKRRRTDQPAAQPDSAGEQLERRYSGEGRGLPR